MFLHFKNLISPIFDEYDMYLEGVCVDYFKFYHPECSLQELDLIMKTIANNKKCKDIFSEITCHYKK